MPAQHGHFLDGRAVQESPVSSADEQSAGFGNGQRGRHDGYSGNSQVPTPADVAITEIESDDLAIVVRDIDGLHVMVEVRGLPVCPKDPSGLFTGHHAPYDERAARLQSVAVLDSAGINQVMFGGLHAGAGEACLT